MKNLPLFIQIPSVAAFDERFGAKEPVLLGLLIALANQKGYAYPTNAYLCEAFGVGESTIRRWMTKLKQYGYIKVDLEEVGEVRKVYINHESLVQKTEQQIKEPHPNLATTPTKYERGASGCEPPTPSKYGSPYNIQDINIKKRTLIELVNTLDNTENVRDNLKEDLFEIEEYFINKTSEIDRSLVYNKIFNTPHLVKILTEYSNLNVDSIKSCIDQMVKLKKGGTEFERKRPLTFMTLKWYMDRGDIYPKADAEKKENNRRVDEANAFDGQLVELYRDRRLYSVNNDLDTVKLIDEQIKAIAEQYRLFEAVV